MGRYSGNFGNDVAASAVGLIYIVVVAMIVIFAIAIVVAIPLLVTGLVWLTGKAIRSSQGQPDPLDLDTLILIPEVGHEDNLETLIAEGVILGEETSEQWALA